MKTYHVEISVQALELIRVQAHYIAFQQNAPVNAKRWLNKLWDAVESLETMPRRFALAPENDYRDYEVRKLNCGDYLILFTIDEASGIVYVIGFRHGRQLPQHESLKNE